MSISSILQLIYKIYFLGDVYKQYTTINYFLGDVYKQYTTVNHRGTMVNIQNAQHVMVGNNNMMLIGGNVLSSKRRSSRSSDTSEEEKQKEEDKRRAAEAERIYKDILGKHRFR